LHIAGKSGSEDMITMILQTGAEPNQRDKNSLKPLNSASQSLNFSVFKILVENTKDPQALDSFNRNVIHYLCSCKDIPDGLMATLLNLFKSLGFNFNISDSFGKLPIHYFNKYCSQNKASFEIIIDNTINLDHEDNTGQTPVMILAKSTRNMTVLKTFISKIRNLSKVDIHGRNLLSNIIENNKDKLDNEIINFFKDKNVT
jgi:ankyrin repeat protein